MIADTNCSTILELASLFLVCHVKMYLVSMIVKLPVHFEYFHVDAWFRTKPRLMF